MTKKKYHAPSRRSKIRTGGHTTHVEGLMPFLAQLESWPEVTSIFCGSIQQRNKASRASTQTQAKPSGNGMTVLTAKQPRKHAKGGGGFQFRATRWAYIGTRCTGIKCNAINGRSVQEVVLSSKDPSKLRQRLIIEGLCDEKPW